MLTIINDKSYLHNKQSNLCNIDLLRGLATIAVLVWHYQHFYYPTAGMQLPGWTPSQQPMYTSLEWLYLKGGWAVRFFWILSGFIFFHVYGQRREISGREFFVNRFSRLYPLHFITLCLVALLQLLSLKIFDHFQIYPENNFYHFFLNLIFASNWGFQSGLSFNFPIWSVSVEILAYAAFFCYLKIFRVNLLSSAAWFFCSILFFYKINHGEIAECIAFFSLGGCVYELADFIRKILGNVGNAVCATLLFLSVLASLIFTERLSSGPVQWMLFPSLIWFAYALDGINFSAGRVGVTFGSLTYASYLIHIPVQIIVIMTLDELIGSRSAVSSPFFLFGFVGAVLALARALYLYVERPLQSYFRRRLT